LRLTQPALEFGGVDATDHLTRFDRITLAQLKIL